MGVGEVQGIYRGAKQCLFEGGIRVLQQLGWPGKISFRRSARTIRCKYGLDATLLKIVWNSIRYKELEG